MSLILCIETATKTCSVALAEDGKLLACKEQHGVYSHAQNLTLFIEEVFKESKRDIKELDAVSVSIGPGSYTGLRIGLSTAKGLCYTLDIPLITVSTLEAMAHSLKTKELGKDVLLLSAIDARRDEVFMALYDNHMTELINPKPVVLNPDFLNDYKSLRIGIIGTGAAKIIDYFPGVSWLPFPVEPNSAINLLQISFIFNEQNKFSDVSYTEPAYLKEFYSIKKVNK